MKYVLLLVLLCLSAACASTNGYPINDSRSVASLADATETLPASKAVELANIAHREAVSHGAATFTWTEDMDSAKAITQATGRTARVFGIVLDDEVKVWYLYQTPQNEFKKCTLEKCITQRVE